MLQFTTNFMKYKIAKEKSENTSIITSKTAFMTIPELFKHKIELSDEELKKYMHGEELMTDIKDKAYGVVTVNGFAVGGVKITQGKLKNLYPRGLRV